MELIHQNKRDGYTYDCIIKGYDTTFWKATTGTPAVSTNYLRFTSAAASSYLQHIFADVEFKLNVPVKPTAGDARSWGLRNPSGDTLGAVYFDISATVFSLKVVDNSGTVTSTTLTWVDGTYSATATAFRIRWEKDQIIAYINGTIVATVSAPTTGIPENALALRIVNGNADNMDLSYVAVRRAASII